MAWIPEQVDGWRVGPEGRDRGYQARRVPRLATETNTEMLLRFQRVGMPARENVMQA